MTGILNITQGSLMWSVRWILRLVRPQVLLRDLSTLMAIFGRHSPSVHHKAVGSKSFTRLY